jgi:uncharacterized protein YdhG (YjbR/CyaY superfamily)
VTYRSIDDYTATFPPNVQSILKKVRATVKKAAPGAVEVISYRMPSLKLHGHLVYYGAFKKHLGLFPPVRDKALKKHVAVYAGPKGNLRFCYDEPIPYALIARIVKARVKEDSARVAVRKSKVRKSKRP